MQDRRDRVNANRNSVSSSHQHSIHPALRSAQHSRESSTESAYSWKCKSAAKHEKQASKSSDSSPAQSRKAAPTLTTPSRQTPTRSESFHKRELLTGPIPLPPISPMSFKPQASTSHEAASTTHWPQLRPSLSPLPESPSPSESSNKHHRASSISSLHNTVRRQQHTRSKSSLSALRDGEDDWTKELNRMESKEKIRQLEVRERLWRWRLGG